jgi:hypothetical protein
MQKLLEENGYCDPRDTVAAPLPVSTEPEMAARNVMLGFDAEERLLLKSPQDSAPKIV